MGASRRFRAGFSLIEMLVVLTIIGVLAVVISSGVSTNYRIGNSYTNAVVSLTDQVEATLYAAQRVTTTSLTMVDVTVSGSWAGRNYRMTYTGAAQADALAFAPNDAVHRRAGILTGATAWPSELGAKPAFVSSYGSAVVSALSTSLSSLGKVSITATNKAFTTDCFVAIVPVDGSGNPLYSGPAGLVVMQGHRIYKYIRSDSGQPWRLA